MALFMGLAFTAGIGAAGGILCGIVIYLAARFLRHRNEKSYDPDSVPN